MVTEINWQIIAQAIDFYRSHDYTYVELPWFVAQDIAKATLPNDASPNCLMHTQSHGTLVGSAEQSFLQQQVVDCNPILDNPGRYVACTPCFRNEPFIDPLHQKTFMKVELYVTLPDQEAALWEMVDLAIKFFNCYVGRTYPNTVTTSIGIDIELCGIEIGSYGIREFYGHNWVYGTGVAEPRFSTALKQKEIIHGNR